MTQLFDGSRFVAVCKRADQKIRAAAEKSLLCGPKWQKDVFSDAAIVKTLQQSGGTRCIYQSIGTSRVLRWITAYWGNLCASPLRSLFLFSGFFCGLSALFMLLAGRFSVALLPFAALLIAGLLFHRTTPFGAWIQSSRIGRWLPAPPGTALRSVTFYLCFCGFAGGLIGGKMGLLFGAFAAVTLLLAPAFLALPPIFFLGALCFLLPVAGTAWCLMLSLLILVRFWIARGFETLPAQPADPFDVLLAIFPLFCIVSSLFSFDRPDSFKVTALWCGLFICAFAAKRIVQNRRQLVGILLALTGGGVLSGLVGLYQYFSGAVNTTWTDTTLFEDLTLRVYSTFANPNVYGEYLLLLVPLVTGLLFFVKKLWQRLLLFGVDLLLLLNLGLTYSRGCYVGLAFGALVFLWNYSKKWMGAIILLGLPIGILLMPASVATRILSIGNMSDTSTSYRLFIYIGTLLMLRRYWPGGIGIGEKAFNAVYPLFALSAIVAPHSHSLFFQSIVSFGIMGFFYLMLLLATYQHQVKKEQRGLRREDRLLMLGFVSLMWGFALQSIFDYTWYNYRVFQLFWLLLAIGFSAPRILKEKRHD